MWYNIFMGYKNTDTERWCNVCKKYSPVDNFHRDNSRKDGYTSYCKPCKLEQNQKWRHKNKEKLKKSQRQTRRKRVYGVNDEHYQDMLTKQSNSCAICQKLIGWEAAVDHCHKTNIVRGLLCSSCNTGIGMLKDDTNILKNAIIYLEKIH